jgi:hypothetical protein
MHQQLGPDDYYFNEQGLMVLTEAYLLRIGRCCESGCLHCPYGFNENKEERTPSSLVSD